ncbi:SDR family oxidoreductase [Nanoarchaeota archaeon]
MRSVLITGCSSGIGKACVDLFSKKGWHVIATMRSLHPHEWPLNVRVLQLDVTDKESIEKAIKKAGQIDVLVNNAGMSVVGAIESSSKYQIEEIFDTNVFGLVEVTKAVVPQMRERNKGVVINISSTVGKSVSALSGYYCATKHAVEAISEALWHELSRTNVKVKIIEPGFTKSSLHNKGKKSDIIVPFYDKKIDDKIRRLKEITHCASALSVARCIYNAATDGKRKLRYQPDYQSKKKILKSKYVPDYFLLKEANKKYR